MYWHVSLHIYPYFRCLLMGRNETKEKESEKGRVGKGGGHGLLRLEFRFLSNLMVAKGLF